MWEYTQLRWSSTPTQYHKWGQEWRLDAQPERVWDNMITALNDLGREGWEAVSVVSMPSKEIGVSLSEYVLLKRVVT